jgi:hypothetical protein
MESLWRLTGRWYMPAACLEASLLEKQRQELFAYRFADGEACHPAERAVESVWDRSGATLDEVSGHTVADLGRYQRIDSMRSLGSAHRKGLESAAIGVVQRLIAGEVYQAVEQKGSIRRFE